MRGCGCGSSGATGRTRDDYGQGFDGLGYATGTLNVMRAGPRGEQVHTAGQGGIDPNYSITTVNIPNDGGDW